MTDANRFLTPPWIIKALGPFDLDPCAAPEAPFWAGVETAYTPEDNGLAYEWEGSVWCAPPVDENIDQWITLMYFHNDGMLMLPAATHEEWFQQALESTVCAAFITGKPTFYLPTPGPIQREVKAPTGYALFAYGEDKWEALLDAVDKTMTIPGYLFGQAE